MRNRVRSSSASALARPLSRGLAPALAVFLLASCSSGSSGSQSPASSAAPYTETVSVGPIDVAAGVETTVCIVVPFGASEDVVVNSIDVNLAPGSHHLIVYKTTSTPRTTPFPCVPFAGIALGMDVPLVFANREQVTWTFPTGIGQDVAANTYVKIEAHYINATATDLQGHGEVTFHTTPKASSPPYQPADFTFWGSTKIDIPPNATASTGKLFQSGIAGTHLISITTHQHRLGTDVSVWESSASGQTDTQIAHDTDWANPSWGLLSPKYDFDGTNGLTYECDWTNTTDQSVAFGESALNEMCFIGGYYYPSKGLDLCIDGNCMNRGSNP